MSNRSIYIVLLLTFQFCYLEWPNNSIFIFQAAYVIFSKTENLLKNLFHPIILLGFITQFIILLGAIFRNSNKKIIAIPIILLTFLVLFFSFIGILSLNYKMIISTIPFLVLSFYFLKLNFFEKQKSK